MHFIVPFLCLILLLAVAIQDFKYRAVSWWLFPLILTGLAGYHIQTILPQIILYNSLPNLGFVLLLFTGITLFYTLKEKRFTFIADKYIGWGDILFFVAITVSFSLPAFLIFVLITLTLGLLWGLIAPFFASGKEITIPLAGCGSVVMIVAISIELITGKSYMQNDWWIINFFQ